MTETVTPFNRGAKQDIAADASYEVKWGFLSFLGKIENGHPSLEYLYAMAYGSSTAYARLDATTKDRLSIGEHSYVDHGGGLLPSFRNIARDCIKQQTSPTHGYYLDFSKYQALIGYMQASTGAEDCTP